MQQYKDIGGWYQSQKSTNDLNMQGHFPKELRYYIFLLNHSAINLHDQQDDLKLTWNKTMGIITINFGYDAFVDHDLPRDRLQMWKLTWKLEHPLKIQIFTQLYLSNRILTWDNGPFFLTTNQTCASFRKQRVSMMITFSFSTLFSKSIQI